MLVGDLELNGGPLLATVNQCDKKLSGFLSSVGKYGSILGGSFVAFEGLNKLIHAFDGVLRMGSHLRELSLSTGQSSHDLVILGHAMELTGGEAGNAQKFLFKLQSSLSGLNEDGGQTGEVVRSLGLDLRQLRGETALKQIDDIQKGLSKVADQSERATIIRGLFGFRFAAKAAPLLADPEVLKKAREQAGPLADTMGKNAQAFHELDVAIKGIGLNMKEFFGAALSVIAPKVTELANAFSSMDLTEAGHDVGDLLDEFLRIGDGIMSVAPSVKELTNLMRSFDEVVLGAFQGVARLFAFVGGGQAGLNLEIESEARRRFVKKATAEDDPNGLGSQLKNKFHNEKTPVSSLQRSGGGGFFFGGRVADPVLSEAQRHTSILERIAANTARGSAPVPGRGAIVKIKSPSH